jgi:hypothetical protein
VRAIKTSVISILAIGLLAGSSVGVGAQDEAADPMAPAVFKIGFAGAPAGTFDETVTETEQGLSVRNNGAIDIPVEAGDARASGLFTGPRNEEWVGRVGVVSAQIRIVNDAGTWSGPVTEVLSLKAPSKREGGPAFNRKTSIAVLTGDGAYEGLTLYLTEAQDEWLGYIIPTDLVPPVPERPAEEPVPAE